MSSRYPSLCTHDRRRQRHCPRFFNLFYWTVTKRKNRIFSLHIRSSTRQPQDTQPCSPYLLPYYPWALHLEPCNLALETPTLNPESQAPCVLHLNTLTNPGRSISEKAWLTMFKSFCGLFGGDAAPVSGSAHDFTVKDIDGVSVHMGDFKGKTLLVVNVASA